MSVSPQNLVIWNPVYANDMATKDAPEARRSVVNIGPDKN